MAAVDRLKEGETKPRSLTLNRTAEHQAQAVRNALSAQYWLEDILKEKLVPSDDLGNALKSGVYLCKAIQKLQPELIKKINLENDAKTNYKALENIDTFINACVQLGMRREHTFLPIDLYEKKNIPLVVKCIFSLASTLEKKGITKGIEGNSLAQSEDVSSPKEEKTQPEPTPTPAAVAVEPTKVNNPTEELKKEEPKVTEKPKNEEVEEPKKEPEESKKEPEEPKKEEVITTEENQKKEEITPQENKNEVEIAEATREQPTDEKPKEEEPLEESKKEEESDKREEEPTATERPQQQQQEQEVEEKREETEQKIEETPEHSKDEEKSDVVVEEKKEEVRKEEEKEEEEKIEEEKKEPEEKEETVKTEKQTSTTEKETESTTETEKDDVVPTEEKKEEKKKKEKKKERREKKNKKDKKTKSDRSSSVSSNASVPADPDAERRKALQATLEKLSDQINAQVSTREKLEKNLQQLKEEVVELSAEAEKKTGQKYTPLRDTPAEKRKSITSGWLEEKGVVDRTWKSSYFLLGSNHTCKYFNNPTDVKETGEIFLINATVYAHVEKKGKEKPLLFNVRTPARDFLLRATSTEEKDRWVKALKASVVKKGDFALSKDGTFLGRTAEQAQNQPAK